MSLFFSFLGTSGFSSLSTRSFTGAKDSSFTFNGLTLVSSSSNLLSLCWRSLRLGMLHLNPSSHVWSWIQHLCMCLGSSIGAELNGLWIVWHNLVSQYLLLELNHQLVMYLFPLLLNHQISCSSLKPVRKRLHFQLLLGPTFLYICFIPGRPSWE